MQAGVVRATLTIAGRDLKSTYLSPFGVGTTAGFVALSGVLLVIDLRGNQARLDSWFSSLFIVVGLLAALVTMRSFADAERTGNLEILLTAPVSSWQVVAGKLLGSLGVLMVVTAATAVCPLLVASMGHPDPGPVWTGYIGFVLIGAAFVAVGLAVSAATGNPLVAATATTAALAALWFGGIVAAGLAGRPGVILGYLSPANHVNGFLRGTVGLVDATYFVSLTLVGVAAAAAVLQSRR
jgi:ABC-2 type transport system permease protein